ncbi:hypothetical protein D4764_02G0010480 [Takifugu flavidus]|uniref:Uncharacterized protein n=1 Tax=Takifugu flavidus TaxID=433684 RepID=A0A5C6NQS2_9TELE|nr:hypothetical protein D4764_02G0010480 [Takifugu flavidus]
MEGYSNTDGLWLLYKVGDKDVGSLTSVRAFAVFETLEKKPSLLLELGCIRVGPDKTLAPPERPSLELTPRDNGTGDIAVRNA